MLKCRKLPKISLLIVNHNRSDYLSTAIESVIYQSFEDFELILWDDGSSDTSLSIMKFYESIDPRIKVFNCSNLGFTHALNQAIQASCGEYIGWVDSDDILGATALEKTSIILDETSSIGVTYTSYMEMDAEGSQPIPGWRCQIPYSKDNLLETFMTFHFRLLRRRVYDQVGGLDLDFRYSQDYDLCLRLSEITDFYHINEYLYWYRIHGNSVSIIYQNLQQKYTQLAIQNALIRRKYNMYSHLK